ncbi:MAG TPA: YdbH domain-containing protein, partial [Caulobacteraceae bacterium]|nr:YdbH domain-containing protein [Caulobacteraceae bacterium]
MRRPIRFAAAALAIIVALALLALYLERKPIAEHLARAWLARHGLASGLEVQSLGLTGLSARLRLGSPADPILTIDRVDIGYGFGPSGIETRSITLVRPRLRLRWTARGPDLAPLQPLIRELSRPPPKGVPLPDVVIEDGVASVMAEQGAIILRGDGELKASVLTFMAGRLDPFRLAQRGTKITGAGGTARIERQGRRLRLTAELGPLTYARGAAKVTLADVRIDGQAPFSASGDDWSGPMRLSAQALGLTLSGAFGRAVDARLGATLEGAMDAHASRLTGTLHLTAEVGRWAAGGYAGGGRFDGGLNHLTLKRSQDGVSLLGDGAGALIADRIAGRDGHGSVHADFRLAGLRFASGPGNPRWSAAVAGAVTGQGAMAPDTAARLTQPLTAADPALAKAAARALAGFRIYAPDWRIEAAQNGARLELRAPARLASGSGAALTLTPRAFSLGAAGLAGAAEFAIAGGGLPSLALTADRIAVSAKGYAADIDAKGAVDTAMVKGARLALKGRLTPGRFDLTGCVPESIDRLDLGANPITGLSAELCPGHGPLVGFGRRGLAVNGRLAKAAGTAATLGVRFADAEVTFTGADALALDHAELTDTGQAPRFRPLVLAGQAKLADGRWLAAFTAKTGRGAALARVNVRQDPATGVGSAQAAIGPLTFAPGGLQPADIAPSMGAASQVTGTAQFHGQVSWTRAGAGPGSGRLRLRLQSLSSAPGTVHDLDADIAIDALTPAVIAHDQAISIAKIDGVVPLTDLTARFDLDRDQVKLLGAQAVLAHGHVRLEPTVIPFAAGSSLAGALDFDHVRLGELIAASSLADAIQTDAVVDGRVPFQISDKGIVISHGELAAVGPGHLSISRKALSAGAPATGQAGFAQDLAYQAMENLAFDHLDASLNSLPNDRLAILFHIKGR